MVVLVEQQMLIILHRMVMEVEEVEILMLKFIEIFIKNKNKIISNIQLRLLGLNEIFVSPLTRFDVKG